MTALSFVERTARRKLSSGAALLALENRFSPTLALSGTLRAGGAHAPANNPVLPAVAAEMLDKGTLRRTKMELAELLESRGASISFSASGGDPDTLDISLSCLSRDADAVFGVLFEMLGEPSFPADELSREKERMIGGVRQLSDQTGWRASTEALRLLYPPGHPYAAETAEELIAAIEAVTVADIRRYFEERCGSSTLVLAAVGDLDPAKTLDEFEARLSNFAAGKPPEAPFPDPVAPSKRSAIVKMKDKVNADVLLAHHSGLRRADPDFLATALGVAALGQSTLSSRLGLRVRDTEGLTYGINARVSVGRYAGPFVVSLTVAPENRLRAVASARSVAEEFVSSGITDRELADEKRSRVGKFKVDLASNAGIAGGLDMAENYGLGVSYLDEFPDRVRSLTRDEVNAAVRAHIRPGDFVEVAAGEIEG